MKVNIKLIYLGHLPHSIDDGKILNWKSELFQLVTPIDIHTITTNSDGPNWSYLDRNIEGLLPSRVDGDMLIALTSVPIENNFFARRFSDNRICVSFYEMSGILAANHIPLENLILRVLYSASFVYRRYGNRIPHMSELTHFAHDETRGCIFDMNGVKTDIVYSTNRPHICEHCVQALTDARISGTLISKVQKELKRVRKTLYYRLTDLIKEYPVCAIIISSLTAVILGILGSLIASWIWDTLKAAP